MRLRREFVSLASVSAVVAAVAAVFPYESAFFTPAAPVRPRGAVAAFVTLSEETEEAAMQAAKTSWQGDAGFLRSLRADLRAFEPPEEVFEAATEPPVISTGGAVGTEAFGIPPYLPSAAAPAPERIPPAETRRRDAFPRSELLNIDVIDRKEHK